MSLPARSSPDVEAPSFDAAPPLVAERLHWRANRRLIAASLAVLVSATFVVPYFARELDVVVFGWRFSFWMAAQGAPLLYGALVLGYVWAMGRLDRRHGLAEPR